MNKTEIASEIKLVEARLAGLRAKLIEKKEVGVLIDSIPVGAKFKVLSSKQEGSIGSIYLKIGLNDTNINISPALKHKHDCFICLNVEYSNLAVLHPKSLVEIIK